MIDIKCLDSSVWLAYYFAENLDVKEIIDGSTLLITSSLCLFEVKKRLLVLKKDPQLLMNFIKQRSEIIVPDNIIAEKAAEIAIEKKLSTIDALLYTTSVLHKAEFITGDNDFRSLDRVRIVS